MTTHIRTEPASISVKKLGETMKTTKFAHLLACFALMLLLPFSSAWADRLFAVDHPGYQPG